MTDNKCWLLFRILFSFIHCFLLIVSTNTYTKHSQFLKTVPSTSLGWKEYTYYIWQFLVGNVILIVLIFLRLYFLLVRERNDKFSFVNINCTVYNIIRWIRCLTSWVLGKTCSLQVTLRDNGTSLSTREVYVSSLDQQGFVNTSYIIKWAI